MVKRKTLLYLLLIFLMPFWGFGQHKIDSLSGKSFEYLRSNFYKYEKDSTKALVYASTYLSNAKKIKDSIKVANGYYYILYVKPENELLNYCDSILNYTKNKINKSYPVLAYFLKGNHYYKNRNFSKSLDNYLLAYYSTKNKKFLYSLRHRIGLLKTRYGEDKEALKLFKETHNYYLKNNYDKIYSGEYFSILFALSDSYLRNGHRDSSFYYNKKGFIQFLKVNDSLRSNYFRLEQGFVELKNKKYLVAIDSIEKSLLLLKKTNDLPNIAFANYILGKSFFSIGNIEKSVLYFKKVDSVFSIVKDIHPDLRVSYEYLINYYKENKNLHKQLEYIEKLLKVDSTLNANYKNIKSKLFSDYNTPKLLGERNTIITKLEDNIKWINKILFLFIILLIMIGLLSMYQFKKRREYKNKFNLLMNNSNFSVDNNGGKRIKNELDISPEIVTHILEKLSLFEKEKGFIEKKIKIATLSERFNTNGKYLSVIINQYKSKSFSNYLNDLRIGYIIEELKTNAVYKKYTIKAISNEAGFSNAESFSKAFYKKTGMYPSFFINQLKNQKLL